MIDLPSATVVLGESLKDPVWFARYVLGVDPWEKQEAILRSVWENRETNVQSCNGSGKSYIAAVAAVTYLALNPGSKVITTAPTQRQVEEVLWREINRVWGTSKVPLGGKMINTSWNLAEDWFALGIASDNPSAYQGFHADKILIVIDEACGVEDYVWEALEGNMSSPNAKRLTIGNPTSSSTRFFRETQRHAKTVKNFTISAFDTPNLRSGKNLIPGLVTTEWVEEARRRYGEGSPFWNARVLGEFDTTGENQLINRNDVVNATKRWGNVSIDGARVLGVDVARFGQDESAAYLRTGQSVQRILCRQGLDTMSLVGEVSKAIAAYKPTTINVDVVGIGAGVVDRLTELQGETGAAHFVNGVNVGAASSDPEKFLNLRAEIFWNLREIFRDGVIALDPEDEELFEQLVSLQYKFTSRGQIQIEKKEDAKKRGIESPDRADAVALSMYADNIVDYAAFTRFS